MERAHMQGSTVPITDEFTAWREETNPFFELAPPPVPLTFEAVILEGGFGRGEQGATLYWRDEVVNEWAEWFPDLATALCRMAALVRASETIGMFAHGPEGFTRWSEQFFDRTVMGSMLPLPEDEG